MDFLFESLYQGLCTPDRGLYIVHIGVDITRWFNHF